MQICACRSLLYAKAKFVCLLSRQLQQAEADKIDASFNCVDRALVAVLGALQQNNIVALLCVPGLHLQRHWFADFA